MSDTQAPQEPTQPSEIEALQAKIVELEAQVKEKENKYLYLYAETENFKKRAVKERQDLLKFGWEPLARDLLQVVDNLERALSHIPSGTDKNLVAGLEMVLNQFKTVLKNQGVQSVDAVTQPFDPNLHEAVAQESSEDVPEGTVLKEHARGYTLHGRLLRPARVVVSGGAGGNNPGPVDS
ncbi:nucleotide exchange factor GrpE [bacterium]|nr:nucleotide exchange factor GrpE [bacterium]